MAIASQIAWNKKAFLQVGINAFWLQNLLGNLYSLVYFSCGKKHYGSLT